MSRQTPCRHRPAFSHRTGRQPGPAIHVRKRLTAGVILASAIGLAGCGTSLNESNSNALMGGVGAQPAAFNAAAGQQGDTTAGAATATATLAQPGLTQAATQLTASSKPGTTAYKIGPLDVLEVSVFKVSDLSKTVQVADSGTINLPLVGEVPAAGLTAQEVERDLTKKLGSKYLQNPQVTVFVKEYNSQRVTVEGAVRKPGVYPIRGSSTLLQMIATAEGVTELADNDVAVFREVNGKRMAAKFNLSEIRSGQAADPPLQQGDTVIISTSALAAAYQNLLKALPIGSFVALL